MRKVRQVIASVLIAVCCSVGAAVWMVNDLASFKMVLLATLVGCAVAAIAYSVYLVLELCHE